ncbi:MAG TPA: hypothetical protein VLH40_05105 [Atribacteraceae bacterium]|nr:hypothetical protein [Atribacteraceae bacterium]
MQSIPDHYRLGGYAGDVEDALKRLSEGKFIERIRDHDHTLWSSQPDEIVNRLGWLDSPKSMRSQLAEIDGFCAALREEGYQQALLLGMGGSSLAPEVFRHTFGVQEGWIDLAVLDSTDPERILRETERLDRKKTLFIVSTKSGGTVETISFFKYFYRLVAETQGQEEAGRHFVAITDSGSSLIDLAGECRFRKIFLNDPNLGGRYSALSHFGCVPAALGGMDLDRLLARAEREMERSGINIPVMDNPGLVLGAAIGECARQGRDKLTFFIAPALRSFGDWVEQLIAESTGKYGKGILPVVGERPGAVAVYGTDRLFVFLEDGETEFLPGFADAVAQAGHPVIRFSVDDHYGLGSQLYRWELATAVAGSLLKINPFDQPDVETAKRLARRMVSEYLEKGAFPAESPMLTEGPVDVYGEVSGVSLGEVLREFIGRKNDKGYISLQAYVDTRPSINCLLDELRTLVRDRTGLATTLGYGPRFLHSTGQLHKGDAGNGLFIQITARDRKDCLIPNHPGGSVSSMSFGILKAAQARGDREALQERKRRVVRFHFNGSAEDGLRHLISSLP